MKQFEKKWTQVMAVTGISCDLCGGSCKINDAPFEEYSAGTLVFDGPYGCPYDGVHVHLELCAGCVMEIRARSRQKRLSVEISKLCVDGSEVLSPSKICKVLDVDTPTLAVMTGLKLRELELEAATVAVQCSLAEIAHVCAQIAYMSSSNERIHSDWVDKPLSMALVRSPSSSYSQRRAMSRKFRDDVNAAFERHSDYPPQPRLEFDTKPSVKQGHSPHPLPENR